MAYVAGAVFRPRYIRAAQMAAQHGEIYRKLGVRPLINAAGTYTILSGSLMSERARRAMEEASSCFVRLEELQRAVGARIAQLLGVESAMVTSGGAGSILLATAACVTGTDPEKIRRIPDLEGMKSEVIVPREHRNGFDHQARTVGVKLVEVETVDDLHRAIGPQTAMLYFTNIYRAQGPDQAQGIHRGGQDRPGFRYSMMRQPSCRLPAIFRVFFARASIWWVSVVERRCVGHRVRACCWDGKS